MVLCIKVILEGDVPKDDTLTLSSFMVVHVYAEKLQDPRKVLTEIGITSSSLNDSQLKCFIDLPLTSVFSCLQQFVKWVDQGAYDFCSLPFTLKSPMKEEDTHKIEHELRARWTGSLSDLVREVEVLINTIKHSENDIIKKVNEGVSQVKRL